MTPGTTAPELSCTTPEMVDVEVALESLALFGHQPQEGKHLPGFSSEMEGAESDGEAGADYLPS